MVFYNHTHITNHKNATKTVTNTRIAWRFRLVGRQFMTEPKIWAKLMCRLAAPSCPPSDFWAKTQNFARNSVIQQGIHAIQFIQVIVYYIQLKTT